MSKYELHYWREDPYDPTHDGPGVFETEARSERIALEKFHADRGGGYTVQFVRKVEPTRALGPIMSEAPMQFYEEWN